PLAIRVVIDARPVLRAHIIALPHALRRIVALPKHPQQLLVPDRLRIEHNEHDLGVTGRAAAYFSIGRVWRGSCGVATRGRVHARKLPEFPLGTPETAQAEDRPLEAIRERRLETVTVDEVRGRDG